MCSTVFFLEVSEPLGRHLNHVREFVVDVIDFLFDFGHQFFGLVLVEFQDAGHLDVHKSQDIILGHLAYHARIKRRQSVVDVFAGGIHVGCHFKFAVFIDTFFDKNLFQRSKVQLFLQLVLSDFQFFTQQPHGAVGRVSQHIADGEEFRLFVFNDAAVG